jgi:uncharacterized protein (DUF1697 family)
MADYAAFLRGINVGGHRPVPMDRLKRAFEALPLTNVRTLLASGNVLFGAPRGRTETIGRKIEAQLKKTFGSDIGVHVRTMEELRQMCGSGPFKGAAPGPDVRLYVTFLSGKRKGGVTIPYESPGGSVRILRATPRAAFSVLTVSPDHRTVDLMKLLEQEFGKDITTRSYTTILRLLKPPS